MCFSHCISYFFYICITTAAPKPVVTRQWMATGRRGHQTGPCQLDRTFCTPQGVVSGSCWHKNFFASYGAIGRYIERKSFVSLSLSIFVTLLILVCFHDKVVIAKKFRVAFTETPPNSIRMNFNSIFYIVKIGLKPRSSIHAWN